MSSGTDWRWARVRGGKLALALLLAVGGCRSEHTYVVDVTVTKSSRETSEEVTDLLVGLTAQNMEDTPYFPRRITGEKSLAFPLTIEDMHVVGRINERELDLKVRAVVYGKDAVLLEGINRVRVAEGHTNKVSVDLKTARICNPGESKPCPCWIETPAGRREWPGTMRYCNPEGRWDAACDGCPVFH